MTIAHHRHHKIPDERTVLLVLIGLGLTASSVVSWNRLQQAQTEKIQQAQAQLTAACQLTIHSNASAIAAANRVNESTALLQSVPRFPGLGYSTAQAELSKFDPCIQNVQAAADFYIAEQLSQSAMGVTGSSLYPVAEWRKLQADLEQAIERLRGIPENADIYTEAQQNLQIYTTKRREIRQRLTHAAEANYAMRMAEQLYRSAEKILTNSPDNAALLEAEGQLETAIQWLETIPSGHTVSESAQANLVTYQQRLADLRYQQAMVQLETLVHDFYNFIVSVDVRLGYRAYAEQLNPLKDRLNGLTKTAPTIVDHPAARSLQTALDQANDAMSVWRYCYEGNCYTTGEANIWDWRSNLSWIPADFPLGDSTLRQAYSVSVRHDIWLWGRSYVQQNQALRSIWEAARQNATAARDAAEMPLRSATLRNAN